MIEKNGRKVNCECTVFESIIIVKIIVNNICSVCSNFLFEWNEIICDYEGHLLVCLAKLNPLTYLK